MPILRSSDKENIALLGREELDITFTKLYAWDADLVWPYEKICFLDADTLILKNIDDVFDYVDGDSQFAAAADIGYLIC